MAKSIFVPTNDRQKRRVKLTVMAKVVQQVEVAPKKLRLSLSEENAGMPDNSSPAATALYAKTNSKAHKRQVEALDEGF